MALSARAGSELDGGTLIASSIPAIVWFGEHTLFVHRAALVHAAVEVRVGRRRLGVLWLVGVYVSTLVDAVMTSPVAMVVWSVVVVCGSLLLIAGAPVWTRRWATTCLMVLATTMIAVAVQFRAFGSIDVPRATIVTYQVGIVGTGVVIAAGSVTARLRSEQLADAVVEIALGPASYVRQLLGDALQDASVEVAFVDGDGTERRWVDELGRRCPPLVGTDRRSVIDIAVDGRLIAQLSCATGLARQPRVIAAIGDATALAARNARLRAALRDDAAQLERSRRRLVVTAGEQRVQLAESLKANTEASMSTLTGRLGELARSDDAAIAEIVSRSRQRLDTLRVDLESLAAGLGPAALAAGDLAAAVGAMTVPPGLHLDLAVGAARLPREVATAAYFVCAEALSNTVKHAEATSVTIRARVTGGFLQLWIADNGRGGAALSRGTGLRGLADRVAALDGTLELTSEPGAGTELTVTLPVTAGGGAPSPCTGEQGDQRSAMRTHGSDV